MKYQSSNLSKEKALNLWFKLHQAMENETINWKAYIDHEALARMMGTNRKYISQVINQATGLSFPSYLNTYRIEAFIQKLQNEEWKLKTIEGLAREVGFDNRATFYRAFQNLMGHSPTTLLKDLSDKVEQPKKVSSPNLF